MGKDIIVVERRNGSFVLDQSASHVLEFVKMYMYDEVEAYLNPEKEGVVDKDSTDCDVSFGFILEDGKTIGIAIGTNANENMCMDWKKACFSDDGKGIPEEKQGIEIAVAEKDKGLQIGIHVYFEPFFTGHSREQEWLDLAVQALINDLRIEGYDVA